MSLFPSLRRTLSGGLGLVASLGMARSAHACMNMGNLEPCHCVEKMLMATFTPGPQISTPSLTGSGKTASPAITGNVYVGDLRGLNYFATTPGDSAGMGNLTITVGDTVTWTMDPGNRSGHTVTSLAMDPKSPGNPLFDSGLLASGGDTYSYTFLTAGEFPYYCQIHDVLTHNGTVIQGSQVGDIIVNPAPEPTSTAILGIGSMIALAKRRRKAAVRYL